MAMASLSPRIPALPVLIALRFNNNTNHLNPELRSKRYLGVSQCYNCNQERSLHTQQASRIKKIRSKRGPMRVFSKGVGQSESGMSGDPGMKVDETVVQLKGSPSSSWSRLKAAVNPWLKSVQAVNVDLPFKIKAVTATNVQKIIRDRLGQAMEKKDLETKVSQTKAEPKQSDPVRKTYIYQDGNVAREQHDFKDAMKLTSQSINEYFKPTKSESQSGFDGLTVNQYELQSYIPLAKEKGIATDSSSKVNGKSDQGDGFGLVKSLEPLVDRVMEIIPAEYRGKKAEAGQATQTQKQMYSKSEIKSRTRALVRTLKTASSDSSRLVRMEELSKHLLMYPETCGIASKEQAIPFLEQIEQSPSTSLANQARECLALFGYVAPLKSRGVRILAIDGGGTRGLMSIAMLKKLEETTKTPIYKLFDYICGVSTGALMAALIGLLRVPLDQVEKVYKEFSLDMFQRSKIVGASQLVLSHAFYDTEMWTNILKGYVGEKLMISTAREKDSPKFSAVSAIVNLQNVQNFMFRNYNLPAGVESHYIGSCQYKMWEAIRASSAAPGYYEVLKLGDYVHQDGGLLTNNPAALAIHECRLLWPNEPLQCVLSLGNGRYEPVEIPDPESYKSIKGKVLKFVQSATDTQAVDTMLHDLLPPSTYFRFNPYMTEDCLLDEIREDKIDQLMLDTEMYLRKNEHKMESAAKQLLLARQPHQKVNDWLTGKLQDLNSTTNY